MATITLRKCRNVVNKAYAFQFNAHYCFIYNFLNRVVKKGCVCVVVCVCVWTKQYCVTLNVGSFVNQYTF